MKFFKKKKKPFELAIDKALEEMQSYSVDSDEYGKAVKNLVMLTEAQSKTKDSKVSGDTIFKTVVGTVIPTVSLLIFENRGCRLRFHDRTGETQKWVSHSFRVRMSSYSRR